MLAGGCQLSCHKKILTGISNFPLIFFIIIRYCLINDANLKVIKYFSIEKKLLNIGGVHDSIRVWFVPNQET